MPTLTAQDHLTEEWVRRATLEQILSYLPQLTLLDLSYLDRISVQRANTDGEFFRDQETVSALRDIMLRHHQRLVFISGLSLGTRDNFYTSTNTSNLVTGDSETSASLRTVRPIEETENARQWRREKRLHSWEMSFAQEESMSDFSEERDAVDQLTGRQRETERIPHIQPMQVYTLKQIAEKIPPGLLGLQQGVDGQPYNLVLRPQAEDDPRVRLLKGYGWFSVRSNTRVLWAAATLEAYNTLIESEIEFVQSPKVERWWRSVHSNDPLAGVDYFSEDCPLFDYQKEAVQFLVRRQRAMLALSPGLGKTLTAAYAAGLCEQVGTILLVCPASLLHYWYAELRKWSPLLPMQPWIEIWHKETGTVPERADLPYRTQFWAITNPETATSYIDEIICDAQGAQNLWDLLIVDESIMYKHRTSKRSISLNRLGGAIPAMWELTGAPATRYLDDMWHQFHMLNNQGYASYWRFAEKYCRVVDNEFSRSVVANRRGAEEAIKHDFQDIYFARTQDQVADIPDWLFVDMDIEMKPKQEAVYQKLKKELRVAVAGHDDNEEIQVDNRLVLTLRSLQVASNPVLLGAVNSSGKWSALSDLMEIYPGPFLVWVNFIRTGEMLQEMLRLKFGEDRVKLANGATPMVERQRLVDLFQAGGLDVLVLNSQVGKFGFTLTKARTCFFIERGFDDSYYQCLHRNRRIGTLFSPIVVNMRSVTSRGGRTIDHVVGDKLSYRNTMISKITYGDLREVIEDEE